MMTTILEGTTSLLNEASAVRVALEELALAPDRLRRRPGTAVELTAELVDANTYAKVAVSSVRPLTINADHYLALTGQLTEMGTSSSPSAGYALSERCALIVPTDPQESSGMCHLLVGELAN